MLRQNSTTILSDIGDSIFLTCNSASQNESITWIQTINKTDIYFLDDDNKTSILNNGSQVQIKNVNIFDEEYYACGIQDMNNSFKIISSYFVYVRGILVQKSFKILINSLILYWLI